MIGRLIATYGHRAVAIGYVVSMTWLARSGGWPASLSVFYVIAAGLWLGWQARGEHERIEP